MTRALLGGWGRFPLRDCIVTTPRHQADVARAVASGPLIARGNGRAYGDSALGVPGTLDMRRMNRFLAFDPGTGRLEAEAGVLLADVIDTFLPKGWFPMVTPGTKFVTLGGAVAADVHGKNHHKDGSFASCVDWLDVMTGEGTVIRASRDQARDLFLHTLGGMGLTGVILRVGLRLRAVESAWIRQETLPAANLAAAIATFEDSHDATYSVAWIDCLARGADLGRSLVMLGEHASRAELPADKATHPFAVPRKPKLPVPINAPSFALNRYTVRAFNRLYYARGAAATGTSLVDWDSYFYPLDAILHWNRIYGRQGFAQYQMALPLESSEDGLTALLTEISAAGQGSFLAVLKRFGPQDSPLSFPMEGYTLALDFPATRPALRLLDRLDPIVRDHGGRFYLAKDARMGAGTCHRTDPRWTRFSDRRRADGDRDRFLSAQSERLGL